MDHSVLACWLSPSLLPVQANVPPYGQLMLRKRKSALSLQVRLPTCSKRYYATNTSLGSLYARASACPELGLSYLGIYNLALLQQLVAWPFSACSIAFCRCLNIFHSSCNCSQGAEPGRERCVVLQELSKPHICNASCRRWAGS